MVSGGLFGIRKRAVSDRRTSGNEQYNPHHPDILREHSEQVIEKIKVSEEGFEGGMRMRGCEKAKATLRRRSCPKRKRQRRESESPLYVVFPSARVHVRPLLPSHPPFKHLLASQGFADMSIRIGAMYGRNRESCEAAVAQLVGDADVASGQFRLDKVLLLFEALGMKMNSTAETTIHALFGRKQEFLDDLIVSEDGHTCLTPFGYGLDIKLPYVRLESLSMILLASVPLMSGDRRMREILPQLMEMNMVAGLSTDLIAHVSKMLQIQCERLTEGEKGEGKAGVLLPDGVVNGLDLVLNMLTAAMDDGLPTEWKEAGVGLLERLRGNIHR